MPEVKRASRKARQVDPRSRSPKPPQKDEPLWRAARVARALQQTAGNRAVQRLLARPPVSEDQVVVQRWIDIEDLLTDPKKRQILFADEIGVDDLEEIQELLADVGEVGRYLSELEAGTKKMLPDSGYKYTRALDMALWEVEKTWMNVQPGLESGSTSKGSRETIPATGGTEKTETFLAHIRSAKPLKDAGAPISHGEYAHRIQWYVIAKSAKDIGSVSDRWLRSLYELLGNQAFVIELPKKYKARAIPDLYLWNAVLDVPKSAADERTSGVGSVGFAAPVALNTHIAKGEGGLRYSQVQQAVLNRKLKRYYEAKALKMESRSDVNLGRDLASLSATMAQAKFDPDVREAIEQLLVEATKATTNFKVIGYDARNAIAFALAGIEPSLSYVRGALARKLEAVGGVTSSTENEK